MFRYISQCLLSLPLPEAQGKFISSPWSLTKLKERHLSNVGLQLPVLSQFLRPDLNARLKQLANASLGFPTVGLFPRDLDYE